jgi:hypothetical protein
MNATDEEDLRLLLHSPALTLQPAPGLADRIRVKARHVRRRRAILSTAATVAVLAAAGAVAPSVADGIDGLRNRADQQAGPSKDPRHPNATTDVVTMRLLNGAEVVTWYEGSKWCTATSRVTSQTFCTGPISPDARGLPKHLNIGAPSLTVDNLPVVAGILGSGVHKVIVHMVDGREFDAEVVEGRGFVRPVWSARLRGEPGTVAYYLGYDRLGREVARVAP